MINDYELRLLKKIQQLKDVKEKLKDPINVQIVDFSIKQMMDVLGYEEEEENDE